MNNCVNIRHLSIQSRYYTHHKCFVKMCVLLALKSGQLLYGGLEKTKNCVKVVLPINKLPYQILNCISLATQKHQNLLCSAFHRTELAKRL